MSKGLLFLIGGAEDRQGDKWVLRHLVQRTRASNIVIVPTASAYPRDISCDFTDAFGDLGIDHIACLDIRSPHEADREAHLRELETADVVFFSGGDQVKLVNTLMHTRFIDRVRQRFEAGELHVAGTSAGATAAGNPMIFHGNRSGLKKGTVKHADGFGFIDGVVVDTHFTKRRRLFRLSQLLLSGRCQKGIGLDEDTGILIGPDHQFEVIGAGMVTVLNSTSVSGSNFRKAENGDMLRFNNMRLGMLPPGSRFSIHKWSVIKSTEGRQPWLTPVVRWASK
ncbi:MAG: cyanophycinase [Desulfosarcina sp.]|jgi:cyanophycinase